MYKTSIIINTSFRVRTLTRSYLQVGRFLLMTYLRLHSYTMASSNLTSLGPGVDYLRPELSNVKIIAVEEHVTFPELNVQFPNTSEVLNVKKTLAAIASNPSLSYAEGRGGIGATRLEDMEQGHIAMQVLSFGSPLNPSFAAPEDGLLMARDINDALRRAVDANLSHYQAFCELPFQAPDLAIRELRRCHEMGFVGVMFSGTVGGTGKFLDAPEFGDLLSELETLNMPLYLHPGIPPRTIIDTYYTIPNNDIATGMMSSGGWGWHSEAGIHVLRLAVTGTLDAHPNLKIIAGHLGEMLPFMIQRFDAALDTKAMGLKRSVGEALRSQIWLAISGLFTLPVTQLAIQTWGVDHILFAVDYPYVDTQRVPDFVKALNDIVGPSDMLKILQTNSQQLLNINI